MEQMNQTEVLAPIPAEVLGNDIVDIKPLKQQGGFSNLFSGHKVGLDTDVVIKRVRKVYHGHMDDKSEAKILTALRHQYLPRVFDVKLASDGYNYTIMEKIPGCTLREYVEMHGALRQQLVLKWTRQLCEVISYMHGHKPRGIVHSDLKPENVMITPENDICVIDFNASLEVEEEGEGRDALGATPGYAAPEQFNLPPERFPPDDPLLPAVRAAQGYGKVGYRTDIYAIGALAYFMLTGYDPKLWCDGVIPLTRFQIVLGDAFRTVIEKAMQVNPRERYATAAAMLKALQNLTVIDRRYRRWRRQANLMTFIVGIGLAASIFTVFLGYQSLREEHSSAYLDTVEQARRLQEEGQYDQSTELLMEAVAMEPERIDAYLTLGTLLYQEGEYQQAVDLMDGVEFEASDALDTKAFEEAEGQVAYILANCYYELEDYASALTNYQLAVHFIPDQQQYQCELAICYAKTGNRDMAEDMLTQLQAENCPQELLSMVTGEIEFAYGNYETAYDSLCQAAELTTDNTVASRCYIQAARCCQQLGTGWIDTEISLLETACGRLDAATSSVLCQMLAEAYINKAAQPNTDTAAYYNKALSCLEQLESRGYATFAVRQNRAVVLEYLDRFEEAEAVLTDMLADYPYDYRVPMRLALLYADEAGELSDDSARRELYQKVAANYDAAQQLYDKAAAQDGEMIRLSDLVVQLQNAGWM